MAGADQFRFRNLLEASIQGKIVSDGVLDDVCCAIKHQGVSYSRHGFTCQPVSSALYKAGYLAVIHVYISLSVMRSFSLSSIACAIRDEYENGGRRLFLGGLIRFGAMGMKDSETM